MSDPFDFDAFIAGTQLARGTVSFFKSDHRTEILRLTREHDALKPDSGDERESSKGSPRKVIADRIATLREEMEASRVEFTIRTLTPDEFKRMQDDNELPEAEQKISIYDQLEWQSVEPVLNAEQWKSLADRIGMAQFSSITKDANDLVLSRVAVPDFSQSVSETLNPPAPSGS